MQDSPQKQPLPVEEPREEGLIDDKSDDSTPHNRKRDYSYSPERYDKNRPSKGSSTYKDKYPPKKSTSYSSSFKPKYPYNKDYKDYYKYDKKPYKKAYDGSYSSSKGDSYYNAKYKYDSYKSSSSKYDKYDKYYNKPASSTTTYYKNN